MSQADQIKWHLENGFSITAIEALHLYKCFRLAARIKNLRDGGMNIVTDMIEVNGKRVARYFKVADMNEAV